MRARVWRCAGVLAVLAVANGMSRVSAQEPPPEFELPTVVVESEVAGGTKTSTGAGKGAGAGSGGSVPGVASSGAPAGAGDAEGAGSTGRRVVEQVATVSEVTAQDIERQGAKTLDEAIDLVPGLYVRNGGDGTPRIDVRGLRTRNILLLLDGVPLNSSFDGQFDPRSIPVENIARIKVTKGASSVLYGAGGNAAVIDIITKSAAPGMHGTGAIEYGGPEQYKASATTSYGTGTVRVFMSGSTYDQSYFELSDDFDFTSIQSSERRVNSDRHDDAVYANIAYEPSETTKFGVSVNYRAGEYGKPPGTLGQDESIFASRTRFERVDDYETVSVQATASQRFAGGLTVRPTLFYNVLDELTNLYDDATFASQIKERSFRQDATTAIYGAGLETAYAYQGGLATLKLDARNEAWESDGFEVQKAGPVGFALDHDIGIYSVALENEFELSEQLSAVLGAGHAWQERAEASDKDHTYLAGLRLALDGNTAVRGSVARKIRFPTLRDLYEVGRANPDLTTEVTQNYEVGLESRLPSQHLSFGLALFHIDAKDFIETDADGIAHNHDQYRFRGVETTLGYTGIEDLRLSAAYTFLESKNLSADADTSELQNRPEHKATLIANYRLAWRIELNASYEYIAGAKTLSRTSPTQVLELGDYHVVGLGITKDVFDGQAQLYARVENLLDENYVQSFGFPEPGLSAFAGLRAKY